MENSALETIDERIKAFNLEREFAFFIRIDDYQKFVYSFLLPFLGYLKNAGFYSTFYFGLVAENWSGITLGDVAQINVKTSPHNYYKKLKSVFFQLLNAHYIDYLSELGVKEVTEEYLEKKQGVRGIDVNRLKVIGIEEYYLNPLKIACIVNEETDIALRNLLVKACDIAFQGVVQFKENWKEEMGTSKALLLHLPVLQLLIQEKNNIYRFLAWASNKTISEIEEVNGVDDLFDWKLDAMKEAEDYFQNHKEDFLIYVGYLMENLENDNEFDEEWLNDWIIEVNKFSLVFRSQKIASKSSPASIENKKTMSQIYDIINDAEFDTWLVVYRILKNTHNVLGINFFEELSLFYSMKSILKVIRESDRKDVIEEGKLVDEIIPT
jgi:hypothetical protein